MADDDLTGYRVLVNDEEQYGLWPRYKQPPAGWRDAGCAGSREECLAFVDRTWLDIRPRSVREQLARSRAEPTGS